MKGALLIAKKTSKNQLTLPEEIVKQFPGVEYFQIRADGGRIVLEPFTQSRDEGEINELLADHLPFAEVWTEEARAAGIEVADPADAMFLDLARATGARWVVSGDTHLTELAGRAEVKVLRPEELRRLIAL